MSDINAHIMNLIAKMDALTVVWRDTFPGTDCDYTLELPEIIYRLNCDKTKKLFTINGKSITISDEIHLTLCRAIAKHKDRIAKENEIITQADKVLKETG